MYVICNEFSKKFARLFLIGFDDRLFFPIEHFSMQMFSYFTLKTNNNSANKRQDGYDT